MTKADFARLRAFLKERSGLDLAPDKIYLAQSRLQPLCSAWGAASPADLVATLDDDPGLADAVLDAMATHETMFFRDRPVFARLRHAVIPGLLARRAVERRLRVWSAAASSGQEAYSLAILFAELGERLRDWHVTILATDLSAACVARGKAGLYSQFEVQRGLPILGLLRHFEQSEAGWRISPGLRQAVRFERRNLLDDFSQLGPFDLVLCRNMLIYLDAAARADLLGRLGAVLEADGVLCLGAAETASGHGSDLTPSGDGAGFFVRGPGRAIAA